MKDFTGEYVRKTRKSAELFAEAQRHLPGGVVSNIRGYIKPHPFYIERAKGSRVWDLDGNEYIDYNCAFGAIIAGHADPVVERAIKRQVELGTIYGTPNSQEVLLTKELKRRYPMMEMFRFTNAGDQSTMYAIRAARAYTGKDLIVKYEGAYHGSNDFVQPSHHSPIGMMGPAWAPSTCYSSGGIPEGVKKDIITAPFNDADALEGIFKKYEGRIAGVIIEPVLGNCGVILPEKGYLEDVRALTRKHNIVLIFDEVKLGLRIAPGGAAEYFGIEPDIVCLAKVVGGGMSLGAYGLTSDLSRAVSPLGTSCHFGTYNAHPVAVAAGLSVLTEVLTDDAYAKLNNLGEYMRKGLRGILDRLAIPSLVHGIGSMSAVLFTSLPKVRNYREAIQCDEELFKKYYMGCLSRGVFLMGALWSEDSVMTLAHTKEDVDRTLDIVEDTLKEIVT